MPIKAFSIILLLTAVFPAVAEDNRLRVDMPEHMRAHMLENMRDHLLA